MPELAITNHCSANPQPYPSTIPPTITKYRIPSTVPSSASAWRLLPVPGSWPWSTVPHHLPTVPHIYRTFFSFCIASAPLARVGAMVYRNLLPYPPYSTVSTFWTYRTPPPTSHLPYLLQLLHRVSAYGQGPCHYLP